MTLTYDDEHLPVVDCVNRDSGEIVSRSSLVKSHLQKFIKSLRNSKYDTSELSFFGCGEYGDNYDRPHFHLLLFGFLPAMYDNNWKYQRIEKFFSKFWKFGSVDASWPRSNALYHYLTKYIVKFKSDAPNQLDGLQPCFLAMSKGIGSGFFKTDKFKKLERNWKIAQKYAALYEWPSVSPSLPISEQYLMLKRSIEDFEKNLPELRIELTSGFKVHPPRYIRKKLDYGSTQFNYRLNSNYFPLWKYYDAKERVKWYKSLLDHDLDIDSLISLRKEEESRLTKQILLKRKIYKK